MMTNIAKIFFLTNLHINDATSPVNAESKKYDAGRASASEVITETKLKR